MPQVHRSESGIDKIFTKIETGFNAKTILKGASFTGSVLDVRGMKSIMVLFEARDPGGAGTPRVSVVVDVHRDFVGGGIFKSKTIVSSSGIPLKDLYPAFGSYIDPTSVGALVFLTIPMNPAFISFTVSEVSGLPAPQTLDVDLEMRCQG